MCFDKDISYKNENNGTVLNKMALAKKNLY